MTSAMMWHLKTFPWRHRIITSISYGLFCPLTLLVRATQDTYDIVIRTREEGWEGLEGIWVVLALYVLSIVTLPCLLIMYTSSIEELTWWFAFLPYFIVGLVTSFTTHEVLEAD